MAGMVVEIDGVEKGVVEWCEEFGVNWKTAYKRIKKGEDPREAVQRKEKKLKHGHFQRSKGIRTREHMTWSSMKSRCQNPNDKGFKNYGGRGITVCQRWQVFENFLADMGAAPEGRTLERVDNNKGYDQFNCIWATPKRQANNRRDCVVVEIDGISKTITEWAEDKGINRHAVYSRLRRGMSPEEAITKPSRRQASRRREAESDPFKDDKSKAVGA